MTFSRRIAAIVAVMLACLSTPSAAQPVPVTDAPSTSASVAAGAQPTVKPPALAHFEPPAYPESELGAGRRASVLLALGIDADGKVLEVTVNQSTGEAFSAAAVAAARLLQFSPAEVDGRKVAVRIQYRYDFTPPAPPPKTTADIDGIVRERTTKKPIASAVVEIDGTQVITDGSGSFHFTDLQPGPHTLSLSGPGFTPTSTEENLVAGQLYAATYDVDLRAEIDNPAEQVDFELVIVDRAVQKSMASTSVNSDQGARVAGTGGDVIKVVENLPGVARSSVGSSSLVVWGAAGADTRVYIDDVHIPVLYHEGGFRSVVHSDLVKSVELEPGGYGAAHGRGLGGLVTVGLKPLEADGYHGSVALDAIDAAASSRGSIGDQFRFAGAVRRSHLDWMLEQVTSKDVGEFVPIPRYWDGQVRAAYVPREGESLEAGALFSSDLIKRSVVAADPADTKSDSKSTGFDRIYLRYQQQTDNGNTATVTPFFGLDRSRVGSRFGAVPAELNNNATVYGLRAAWNGRPLDFVVINTGLDLEVVESSLRRSGAVTTPPREGDIFVFGQVPSDQVNGDTWTVTSASLAPFTEADFSLVDGRVHIVPGMRIEPALERASRRTPVQGDLPALGTARKDTQWEPRLAARWSLTEMIALRAAVGVYHQPPLSEDLSAVFGNPQLHPSKALHYLAGINFQVTEAIAIEATTFYSKQSELVTRSPLATPVEAQALIQDGLGRAYGGQALLRHDLTERFFGWLSYSLVRSERTDGGSPTYRPFDFDQTHVLTALASYDLGLGFEFGARFRFSTGYPRTPVKRAVDDARTDSYAPLFGTHNSLRIPAFYELDARLSKRFTLAKDAKLELYLDVQNVTNHGNPEEIVYNYNYTKKSYITGLPVLPVIGGKLVW
jgi:TonB family protein